ncbi:hypothetical protein A2U01_0117126, partial [Trifolium medium]|nr:hypothetical protein [Trifolium medium]
CLEQPLSKYQSSLDEALKEVWAIKAMPLPLEVEATSSFLGFHSFCVKTTMGSGFG